MKMPAYHLRTWALVAVPFFRNTLLGDLGWALVLFGALAVVERAVPAMREPVVSGLPARA